jgi:hypothetical protein
MRGMPNHHWWLESAVSIVIRILHRRATMTRLDHTGRFAMLSRSLLELPANRPLDVACAAGTLWLTLDNDSRDLVLERGERARIEANRRVLVYAFDDSVLELREVPAPDRATVPAWKGAAPAFA